MVEIIARRQKNGTLLIRQELWDWINVAEGEEVLMRDDDGKHGRFISFWKKPIEDGDN